MHRDCDNKSIKNKHSLSTHCVQKFTNFLHNHYDTTTSAKNLGNTCLLPGVRNPDHLRRCLVEDLAPEPTVQGIDSKSRPQQQRLHLGAVDVP